MWTAKNQCLLWLATAAIIIAGAWGTSWYMRWRHERVIEARLAALAPLIWKYSQDNGLPVELVRRVIRAESGGDESAVSPKNAKGLMQITPIALEEVCSRTHMGQGDLFEPDYNIRVGTAYLRMLLARFDGDAYLAVAAYNMGPTKLLQARRENPGLSGRQLTEKIAPAETIRYCRNILGNRDIRLSVH